MDCLQGTTAVRQVAEASWWVKASFQAAGLSQHGAWLDGDMQGYIPDLKAAGLHVTNLQGWVGSLATALASSVHCLLAFSPTQLADDPSASKADICQ
jgi:hypothetical protein